MITQDDLDKARRIASRFQTASKAATDAAKAMEER